MCVIVVNKDTTKHQIDKKTFEKMWERNSDGLGLTYWDSKNSKWVRIKGIMAKTTAWNYIKYFQQRSRHLIVHFRLTSKGKTTPELTHPFEFYYIKNKKKGTYGIGYLFHNGTIHKLGDSTRSDTLELSEWISALRLTKQQLLTFIYSPFFEELVSPSRICIILEGEKMIHTIGNFKEYNGLLVSNLSWNFQASYKTIYGYSERYWNNDYSDYSNKEWEWDSRKRRWIKIVK